MGTLVINNIPDDVLARLRDKAQAEGKSLEQIGREALAEWVSRSRRQLFDEVDAIRQVSQPVSGKAINEEIRRDRDLGFGTADNR